MEKIASDQLQNVQLWQAEYALYTQCLNLSMQCHGANEQEAQLMLTTGSTRLAVSRGQQTWYHSTCYI